MPILARIWRHWWLLRLSSPLPGDNATRGTHSVRSCSWTTTRSTALTLKAPERPDLRAS